MSKLDFQLVIQQFDVINMELFMLEHEWDIFMYFEIIKLLNHCLLIMDQYYECVIYMIN